MIQADMTLLPSSESLTTDNRIIPDWPAPATVSALLTTRNGGISQPPYTSLNLGDHVGDDPAAVIENRALLRQILPDEPRWLKQVHGTTILDADNPDIFADGAPGYDAAISQHTHTVCVVMTADCLPILLCDEAGSIVAAIHAGWRGLSAGVIENTVRTITARSAGARLMAWIGPAIGPGHFEVGNEVRDTFIQHDKQSALAFTPSPDQSHHRWMANLFLLARQRLAAAGVRQVYGDNECTFSNPSRFFSYRRDGTTGRMAALIWLTA